MTDRITAQEFHAEPGVSDWRVLINAALTTYRTGSFTAGVELVDAIGELAEAAGHHPDVDLRYGSVSVRLTSHDVGGLSRRDVALAQQISQAAQELDLRAEPVAAQSIEIAVDALVGPRVQPFWRAVLGYQEGADIGDAAPELTDALGHGPTFWFQQMDEPRTQRNRIHIDVHVPHDEAESRVEAAVAAGGHVVDDGQAPAFWVVADAEGNEACVCTWQGRG